MSISGYGPDNPALEYEVENMDDREIDRLTSAPKWLSRQRKEPTWTTRDGAVILIRDMTDSHLVNTISFLRRNVESYKMMAMVAMCRYSETAPDGAADAADSAAEAMDEADTDDVLEGAIPQFSALRREAKRRKLWAEAAD